MRYVRWAIIPLTLVLVRRTVIPNRRVAASAEELNRELLKRPLRHCMKKSATAKEIAKIQGRVVFPGDHQGRIHGRWAICEAPSS